ncbi:MAG: ATP-binding protein [Myxococcaceae bacterium]
MGPADLSQLRGRILVVGGKSTTQAVLDRLSAGGYFCASADSPAQLTSVAEQLRPEAILVAGKTSGMSGWLTAIKGNAQLNQLPLLADVVEGGAAALRKSEVDDYIHSYDELARRLETTLRAKRAVERDEHSRARMEALLEITRAATSSLDLEEILRIAVDKIGQIIHTDRCSVVLVEGMPRNAQVVASREHPELSPFNVDILRYPEIRKALTTREAVLVEDAARDPLMDEVRRTIPLGVKSILVQPLVSQDDVMGALFLRVARGDSSFATDEVEFARAAAAALANSVRNARLHSALKRKREDLEAAYVDRYRELNDANKRLKELNRLKDEIIAVVSHDLRAPLQVMLGHGRLLADAELPKQPHASAEAIVRQGKKILDLVESLLEKGKGEQARLSLNPRLTDVAEICKEQTAELEILATQRGVALRSETPESLMVVGDEVKLRQVLQNLITNAIGHASKSGVVVVRTQRLKRPDGEAVKIRVEDDGAGIPVEQLHLVFDRYRHGPGGVGLGLAICKEFVELHGGEIWAERLASGGTAFVVTLPLAQGPETCEGAVTKPQEPTVQPRVLVVEDEPEVAAVVTEILRSRYRVELARDGAEGVAKARALHPDLVVMDVFLPKLDGLDAAVALKSSTDTQDIPVILLSAHQGVAEKVRAMNLGAVDYLSKPFQAAELLNRTDRAIKLRSTEKELQRSLNLLKRSGSDPETGLFDRSGLVSRIDQELARTRRYNRPVSVAVCRPDEPMGDRVRVCAAALRRRLRTPDVLGHLGNGNFGALLPECTAPTAHAVFTRVLLEVQEETGVLFKVSVANVADSEVPVEAVLDHLLAGKK